jgi:uncharacterized protein (TIGR03435 family)
MTRFIARAGLSVLAASIACGQSAEPTTLTFEVASVKLSGPQSIRGSDGGPGTRDPERFTFGGAGWRDLLGLAYGLEDAQQQISGPGWIDSRTYDIAVKIPQGTTKEQFQRMLQNLLMERFKLVVHHETKQLPVYTLVIAKSGPKFKESAGNTAAVAPSGRPATNRDRDDFPVLPAGTPGLTQAFGPGARSRWTGRQQPMSVLAKSLSGSLATGRIVIDKTGLTGRYDFTLEYDLQRQGGIDDPSLSVFDAVQQQLGLRLEDGKAPFDLIVVDRGERVPTDN